MVKTLTICDKCDKPIENDPRYSFEIKRFHPKPAPTEAYFGDLCEACAKEIFTNVKIRTKREESIIYT